MEKISSKLHRNTDDLERRLLAVQRKTEHKVQHSQIELEKKLVSTMDEKIKKSTKKLDKKIGQVEKSIPDTCEMISYRQLKKYGGNFSGRRDSGASPHMRKSSISINKISEADEDSNIESKKKNDASDSSSASNESNGLERQDTKDLEETAGMD